VYVHAQKKIQKHSKKCTSQGTFDQMIGGAFGEEPQPQKYFFYFFIF
jgi:hypothetical protein